MVLRSLYRDAVRKYNKDGLVSTVRAAVVFLGRFVSGGVGASSYQTDRRVDTDQRVGMIEQYLDAEDANLLDVGCAEGELTRRLASEDRFCLGLDISEVRLAQARKHERLDNNVRFLRHEITPGNVDTLPAFDVALLLTVYQHWGSQFGWDDAEDMLRVLAGRSDKLFFEVPDGKFTADAFPPRDDESDVAYYHRYLEAVLDESVPIEHVGMAEYKGDERSDPLFYLECRKYDR